MTNFGKEYEKLEIIGTGTYARVIMCIRNFDGKKFAVKIYDKSKIKSLKNI